MKNFSLKEAAKTQWQVLGITGVILMVVIYSVVAFLIYCSFSCALSDNFTALNEIVIASLICDALAGLLIMLSVWLYDGMFSETDFDV